MWLSMLFKSLQLIPLIVAGIEHIHGEAPGATKKQMAMDALQLATGVAQNTMPDQYQPAIAAATQLASTTIDGVVATYNATGWKALPPAPAPPAPAAPAAPAVMVQARPRE